MTLLAKMRDMRGSLRVSIDSGSPMAVSMRSGAVAYASGVALADREVLLEREFFLAGTFVAGCELADHVHDKPPG